MRSSLLVLLFFGIVSIGLAAAAEEAQKMERLVLVDYQDFPEKWEARGGEAKARRAFRVVSGEDGAVLTATGEGSVRIFKKIAWDSGRYPDLEWRWRVTKWPDSGSARVFVYVSLDTDLLGIPTMTKYYWSRDEAVGTETDGGFFRPMEVVIRSGAENAGDWISERLSVRADFERYHDRAPKGEAYGIGFLVDPGVVVEIGPVTAVGSP